MKGSRFNEEQIIAVLREQEAGARTEEVCRRHGISRGRAHRRQEFESTKWRPKKLEQSIRFEVRQGSVRLQTCSSFLIARESPTLPRTFHQRERGPDPFSVNPAP